MANAWRRFKPPKLFSPRTIILLFSASLLFVLFVFLTYRSSNSTAISRPVTAQFPARAITSFDCFQCPQSHPVIANVVEGLKFPFIYSLTDLGTLPDKPHKNIVRTLKGKLFRKPDISASIQEVLEDLTGEGRNGLVVDVGANVGMATFAAAVMGFRVLAFEPVFENLQRICDGVYFNRVADLVTVFEAAVSDRRGNITFHKLLGRLDNSAVSAEGARMAFKSNEEVPINVRSVLLDEMIQDSEPVVLLKIDVQGWEYHVLKGASKLLSRKGRDAPYVIYEEDEHLLRASNSSAKEIRGFLKSMGYDNCSQHGTDTHCIKKLRV